MRDGNWYRDIKPLACFYDHLQTWFYIILIWKLNSIKIKVIFLENIGEKMKRK